MTTATAIAPHECRAKNAATFLTWIRERGGLALFRTLNLSDPDQSWTAPVHDKDGAGVVKPHMYAENAPHRVITDPEEVLVHLDREVNRFRIAVEQHGFSMKLTAAASRKVRAAMEKAGPGAYHLFDHDTQEAIIFAPEPGKSMTLAAWAIANNL